MFAPFIAATSSIAHYSLVGVVTVCSLNAYRRRSESSTAREKANKIGQDIVTGFVAGTLVGAIIQVAKSFSLLSKTWTVLTQLSSSALALPLPVQIIGLACLVGLVVKGVFVFIAHRKAKIQAVLDEESATATLLADIKAIQAQRIANQEALNKEAKMLAQLKDIALQEQAAAKAEYQKAREEARAIKIAMFEAHALAAQTDKPAAPVTVTDASSGDLSDLIEAAKTIDLDGQFENQEAPKKYNLGKKYKESMKELINNPVPKRKAVGASLFVDPSQEAVVPEKDDREVSTEERTGQNGSTGELGSEGLPGPDDSVELVLAPAGDGHVSSDSDIISEDSISFGEKGVEEKEVKQ